MKFETLKIFNEQGIQIGKAQRDNVHQAGYWHETFHCWIVSHEDGTHYVYFQIRSDIKKDFPNLLDITAAGHILAHEEMRDGIREIKEELGLDVSFDQLVPLGVVKQQIKIGNFIDKEICNVFLYQTTGALDHLKLQEEEVSGVVKAEVSSFIEFCLGKSEELLIEGYQINQAGGKTAIRQTATKSSFVPHETTYLETVAKELNSILG